MLYPIQKADIQRASRILADAFQNDPIWSAICDGESNTDKRRRAIFEIPLRQALAYGEAVATSAELEGIVAWIPGAHLDLGVWQLFRIGGLSAATRMGGRVAKKAGDAFKPVTEYRNQHLAGMDFLYLLVLGVPDRHRGKGFGGQLVRAAIQNAEQMDLPLYVGAGSEDNVSMYEHFGFKVVERIDLPLIGLPNWEMVWNPGRP